MAVKSSPIKLSGSSSKTKSSSKQSSSSLGSSKSCSSSSSSVGPTYNFSDTLGKRCLTSEELNKIQRCCPYDEPYVPQCICVQQTPSIICHKNIVWVQKINQEPDVVNTSRFVMVPKVVKVAKAIRIPEVTWTEGYVKVPKIEYRKTNITEYDIKQTYKDIIAPQEICTSFLCRPKPQYVLIPPPTDYCCYSLNSLNSSGSPRSQMEEHPSQLAYRVPETIKFSPDQQYQQQQQQQQQQTMSNGYSDQQNYGNQANLGSSMGGNAYTMQDTSMRNTYGNESANGYYGNSYQNRGTGYDSYRFSGGGGFMPVRPMFNSNPYQPNYFNSIPYNNYIAPYSNCGYGYGSFSSNGMSQPIYAAA